MRQKGLRMILFLPPPAPLASSYAQNKDKKYKNHVIDDIINH